MLDHFALNVPDHGDRGVDYDFRINCAELSRVSNGSVFRPRERAVRERIRIALITILLRSPTSKCVMS